MTTEKLLRQAEQHVGQGEIQKALSVLQQSQLAQQKNYRRALTLIAARWSAYAKAQRKGVVSSENLTIEYNRITDALLDLIHEEPEAAHTKMQAGNLVKAAEASSGWKQYKTVIVGALLTFVLGIAGKFIADSISNDEPKEVLIEYRLSTLTPEERVDEIYVVKIYRDYTGEMILDGKTTPLEEVDNASETFLAFTVEQLGDVLRYNGLKSITNPYDYLEGTILKNQEVIGKWQATVLE